MSVNKVNWTARARDRSATARHKQTGGGQASGSLHHVIVRGIEKSTAGGLMTEQARES